MAFTGFYIDNAKIKDPNEFNVEYYTLTQSTRIANGDMTMDFVANKRKYNFKWNAITSAQLDVIIDLLWTNLPSTHQCFHALTYTDDRGPQSATVYAGAIPHKLHRGDGPRFKQQWVWKDVTLSLIEQ